MISVLSRFAIKKMLRNGCPDNIPRSGKEGRQVSCYSICLKNSDGEWLLLVDGMDATGFTGLRWTGTCFNKPDLLPFPEIEDVSIEIHRYIGLFSFTYSSVFRCVIHDWTYLNRVPIIKAALSQFFFNRKDLGFTDRVETLQALVQKSIDAPDFRVNEITLPSLLHGNKWILHPDKEKQRRYARFLLESFEESGELEKSKKGAYRITGKALKTLSMYEIENQRHEQALLQSTHMKWLTLVLILVGLASAIVTYMVS